MGIEEMLDRVIVIDNLKEEMVDLVERLQKLDIAVDAPDYTEDYNQLPVYSHDHQLIFMDLMLDEDEGHLTTNISRVIQILNHIVGPGFGPYGLVLWTKHLDKLEQVLTRFDAASKVKHEAESQQIEEDEVVIEEIPLPNPPVFVIGIDKVQFKASGEWDFSNVIPIINEEIKKSNASYFFLRWLSATRQAAQGTISSIYTLTSNYQNKEQEIGHILYLLAKNHTGINHTYPGLTSDTYKAFNDIIHPKINALTGSEILPDYSKVDTSFKFQDEDTVLAHLNTILFIDEVEIDQNEIVPGNVYQVMDANSPLIVKTEERVKLQKKKPKSEKLEGYRDYDCIPIAIELTPPCDFSNKKISSRLVGGYMMNYVLNENSNKKLSSNDKTYVLPPVIIPGDNAIKYVIFDFRHLYTPTDEQLKDPAKFKVLFRANRSLFSDVLQKFSSHAARLGLNGLEPWK